MSKNKNELITQTTTLAENTLFSDLTHIIESTKARIYNNAGWETVMMFWDVGNRVNNILIHPR